MSSGMAKFVSDNLSTIIIGTIIALWLMIAVIKIVSDKKKGKSSCSGCPHRGTCHSISDECKKKKIL